MSCSERTQLARVIVKGIECCQSFGGGLELRVRLVFYVYNSIFTHTMSDFEGHFAKYCDEDV